MEKRFYGEEDIRADERRRIREQRKKNQRYFDELKKAHREDFKQALIRKFMGIILLVIPVILLENGYLYDGITHMIDATIMLVCIPVGLYFIFAKKNPSQVERID